jgi:hypothetical protein
MSFNVTEFRKIEQQVLDRSIEAMSVNDLTKIKVSLVTNTPTAEVHPIIQTSWDRAYKEITSQIDSKVAKRRFIIAIFISSIIIFVSVVNLVRGFM